MKPDWEEKAERLLQWVVEGKNSPYTLEIHPTFRCNLHCVFCEQEDWRQRGIVDFSREIKGDRWLEIIGGAAQMGVREIRLCGGGEPMYNPDVIVPMFREIKALGMRGCITTNGTMFTEDTCKLMVDIGWDRMEFSIDGSTKETHEGLRGVPGCFQRSVEAVRQICGYRRVKGVKSPFITISFVVNNKNFREIPQMVELFGPMGVDELSLLTLHPKGMAGDTLVIPTTEKAELWEVINEARTLAQGYGMHLFSDIISAEENRSNRSSPVKVISSGKVGMEEGAGLEGNPELIRLVTSPCYEPWYYMQVLHDGLYSPCCNSYFEKTSETLHENKLEDIWVRGSHMRKVRGDLLNKEFNEVCRECDVVNLFRTAKIRDHLLGLCEENRLLPMETIRTIRERSAVN